VATQHVSAAYAAQSHPSVPDAFLAPAPTPVPAAAKPRERGLAGWLAVLVLIAIAAVGGIIDLMNQSQVKGGFNISIVVAAVVAIVLVRRSAMFPVVVAPPLVYFAASAALLYARSGGLHDRKVLLDAAANWLVYGFPAIAGATAAVLIIAGIRLVLGR
jgi:Gpi18-like mannosyltransferase